jgi:tetratricopeptide (TPR) repeat protein
LALAALAGCRAFSREGSGPRSVAASRQLSRQGTTAMERGDWPGAESLLHKAVEACPLDVEARRSYSETLWHRGATGAAIVQLEEARRVAPEDVSLAVRAGELYLSLDRLDKAREASDQALDVDPKYAAAWALRGQVMERSGQLRPALAAYQRALGYEPGNTEWLLRLAESYRRLGTPSRALAALQTLIDTYPSGEEPQQVLYLQGLALSALGRYSAAAESFATATQRGGPTAELLCRLAEAQLMAGRAAEAQSSVQQALALEPAHQGSLLLAQRMQIARSGPPPSADPNLRR